MSFYVIGYLKDNELQYEKNIDICDIMSLVSGKKSQKFFENIEV